jgi:DNA polymerase-3 subunit beta
MAAGSPVTIKLQSDSADAMIGFESGGRRLTTRLIAGEFIKYRSRFPADFGCRADLPAGPFVEAVRRVSLVAERGSAVRLVFGSGTVAIEAGTQGRARARETVPAEFTGSEPEIAFSPHFLLDGITAAGAATAPAATVPAATRPSEADPGGAGDAQPSEPADPPDRASAVIRLEFSSATKPAVITGVRGRSARPDSAGTEEPAAPDFRYLVVPLRAPARQ